MAQKKGCDCLWFAFRTDTTFRYLDATAIAQAFGDAKCAGLKGLPAFHALTGCDVILRHSSGRENVPPGQHGDATPALCTLPRMPTT